MTYQSAAHTVGQILFASSCQLTLQGWAGPLRRSVALRKFCCSGPKEAGKVCYLGLRTSQADCWSREKFRWELQHWKVKRYCTKSRQHTQDETDEITQKNGRVSLELVSDTSEGITSTKECKGNYSTPESVSSNEENNLNIGSKVDYSHTSRDTNLMNELGTRKSETVNGAKAEEVDMDALVKLEVELNRQEGSRVPSNITPFQWQELLTKKSMSARKKYLAFLFVNEKKREKDKEKKEIRRKIREEQQKLEDEREEVEDKENQHIQYGLWRNSIFLKILDTTVNHFYHTQVISAMMHGQPLLMDLSFDEHMTPKERQNCAYQLQMLIGINRIHAEPYNLQLCNAGRSADTIRRLERFIPPLFEPEYPLTVTPENYLSLYPKDQLIYLTPHCREEMTQFDHNAVYIIGGIVDKSSGNPLTLAKAKREGIRMQKLPLDRFLSWGFGGKCLTLNQIVSILLDMKHTGDWHYSLRHVPKRKLRPPPTEEELEALLYKKRAKQRKSSLYYYSKRNY